MSSRPNERRALQGVLLLARGTSDWLAVLLKEFVRPDKDRVKGAVSSSALEVFSAKQLTTVTVAVDVGFRRFWVLFLLQSPANASSFAKRSSAVTGKHDSLAFLHHVSQAFLGVKHVRLLNGLWARSSLLPRCMPVAVRSACKEVRGGASWIFVRVAAHCCLKSLCEVVAKNALNDFFVGYNF